MKENITKLESRRDNARTFLNELDEKLETQENAYQAINTSVLNHFNEGNIPKVEIIKYIDEKDKEKIMLKLDIDEAGTVIYKAVSEWDIALYLNDTSDIGSLSLMNRCNELAINYLKKQGDITGHFNDFNGKAEELIQAFINNPRNKRNLEREVRSPRIHADFTQDQLFHRRDRIIFE
jgi:hypothetical protein